MRKSDAICFTQLLTIVFVEEFGRRMDKLEDWSNAWSLGSLHWAMNTAGTTSP